MSPTNWDVGEGKDRRMNRGWISPAESTGSEELLGVDTMGDHGFAEVCDHPVFPPAVSRILITPPPASLRVPPTSRPTQQDCGAQEDWGDEGGEAYGEGGYAQDGMFEDEDSVDRADRKGGWLGAMMMPGSSDEALVRVSSPALCCMSSHHEETRKKWCRVLF